jgi:hypothetical protein
MSLKYGLRPLTSWRFAHTRPRGNQRLFPLGSPSRPATFSLFTKQQLRKGRHGVDPAFNFIFSQPRPYSKMLTLPIGHPWPTKASLTSCQAHAIFFNGLKFRVESHHFQVKKTNSFLPPKFISNMNLWPHHPRRKKLICCVYCIQKQL